jgi:spore germination protein KC
MKGNQQAWKMKLCCSLVMCFCLTACWDLVEVNQMAIVNFIGMDINPEEGGSTFYYHIVNPSGIAAQKTSGINAPVYTFRISSKLATEVPSKLLDSIPKRPFFDHSEAMVVTERAARKGIVDQLNFMEKQRDRQSTINMLVTDSPLSDFMQIYTTLERLPGNNVRTIIENQSKESGEASYRSRIKDVVENLDTNTLIVLPLVSVSGSHESSTTQRYEHMDANEGSFILRGGALIKQGAMIGKLSASEMPFYNLLNGEIKMLHQIVNLNEGHVDLWLKDILVKKHLIQKSGHPVINIQIKAKVHIDGNTQETKLTADNLDLIIAQLSKQVVERSNQLYEKTKAKHWDIMGIEEMISHKRGSTRKKANEDKGKWEETELAVSVHFVIQTFGNTLDPYKSGDGDG